MTYNDGLRRIQVMSTACAKGDHQHCGGTVDVFEQCACDHHEVTPCTSWYCQRERDDLRRHLKAVEAQLARVTQASHGDTRSTAAKRAPTVPPVVSVTAPKTRRLPWIGR